MKLTIKGQGLTAAHGYVVLLDGIDITDYLSQVTLNMGASGVNAATISFFPTEVEVDAEALATLEAHLEQGEQK